MSSTKIIIICLALLMTVFFIGLSFNLIDKDNQGLEKATPEQQKKAATNYNQGSWLKSIDGLLAPFADSITASGLVITDCSKSSKGIILNQHSSRCEIKVKGFAKPAFQKLSLSPKSNSLLAKLKVTYNETGKEASEPSFWSSKDPESTSINFVFLGKEELQGKYAATITLECVNGCANQQRISIIFDQ